MFYKIDSRRVSFREYWWGTRNPLVVLAWLTKLLRIQLPSSADDPNVDSLEPFEVGREELPHDIQERFTPFEAELVEHGFHSPVYHLLRDGFHSTEIAMATFCHRDGQAFGRIFFRHWRGVHPHRIYCFPMFVSEFQDGSYLISSAGKADMAAPATWTVQRRIGTGAAELWDLHQQELERQSLSQRKTAVAIRDQVQLVDALHRHHETLRDFHVQRGVFVPMTEREAERASQLTAGEEAAAASGSRHPEVLAAIEKIQQKKPGWGSAILILAVTLAVFVGAGSIQWNWRFVLLLIPVLFFHELGHYIAMRIFHYRNLRMFFIPFFGAAVSGQNYNVAGWKKVIVSMMGPLPGIAVGAVLGGVGWFFDQSLLLEIAMMAMILNGLNLLPVLPLDGGWILHSILFCRHPLLDGGFRLLAAFALCAGGMASGDKILMYLSIPMFVGLPTAYRVAKVVAKLRRQGIADTSADDQTMPAETAEVIIDEIKAIAPRGLDNKLLATLTLQAFESLNARPPNVFATIGFGMLHSAGIVAAAVFAGLFLIAQQGDLMQFAQMAANQPENRLRCGSVKSWYGVEAQHVATDPRITIIAEFPSAEEADKVFVELCQRLPAKAALKLFGQAVLLDLPANDEAAREEWLNDLDARTDKAYVHSEDLVAAFTVLCIARSKEDATEIAEEVREYFDVPSEMFLVTPWSADDVRTDDERRQHRKARRTFQVAANMDSSVFDDERLVQIDNKAAEATRRGDQNRVTKLREQHEELVGELRKQSWDQLRQRDDDQIDGEVINLYLAYEKELGADMHGGPATLALGRRLGQFPLENNQPPPGAGRFSYQGFVVQNGLLLEFHLFSEKRPFDCLPALTDWLCRKNCADLKYRFETGFLVDALEE